MFLIIHMLLYVKQIWPKRMHGMTLNFYNLLCRKCSIFAKAFCFNHMHALKLLHMQLLFSEASIRKTRRSAG